jgi:hypothetical protein
MTTLAVRDDGGHGHPTRVDQELPALPAGRTRPRALAADHQPGCPLPRPVRLCREAHLADGTVQPLIRLRYGGSARSWGFGLYLASSGRYENQILPSGSAAGSPEEALDCACGLYLADSA